MPIPVVMHFLLAIATAPPPWWVRRFALLAWVLACAVMGTDVLLSLVLGATGVAHPVAVVAAAMVLVGAGVSWRTRRGAGFLEVAADVSVGRIVSAVAMHMLLGYLALVPLAAFGAFVLVSWYGAAGRPQAQWFVLLVGVWLPLWWAPAVGPWWAWRRALAPARRTPR